VTQHQLNSEANEETGYTPYDLVFGKAAMRNIPDMSNTGAAASLATYLDNLTQHMQEIRAQAHLRRTKRQAQRLEANDPPGNHYYLAGDLVFVRNESHLRKRKFISRNLGPYAVISQREDGAVSIRSLVDQTVLERHHNQLRIFEGTLREATILARLDENEELILSIDEYEGSVYERITTKWRVNWHDFTTTWETYRAVQYCTQLKEFAASKFFLTHRFTQSGEEFKEWSKRVNKCTYEQLLDQADGYYPTVDASCRSPFAWSVHFFKELLAVTDNKEKHPGGGGTAYKLVSSDWNSFLTVYLVKKMATKYDLFIPALSKAKTYAKFPAVGAYLISVTPAQVLQFAHALPTSRKGMFNADEDIIFTNFRELVWPETWAPTPSVRLKQARLQQPLDEEEEAELEEGLMEGEHTGKQARVKSRGKWHSVSIDKRFPDGSYLVIFSDDTEAKVPLRDINFLKLLRREERRERGSDA